MNAPDSPIAEHLRALGQRWLPRLLTQVCRDPGSPAHGCFDRDWWHYRIRDFPSVILQQGGSALAAAAQLDDHQSIREPLLGLARASCSFWNRRALRRGAFEEYYPWEQGYPPLAFSTLAVVQLAGQGVVEASAVQDGARVAARQLRRRFEAQAANQQVAGLAALAWCRRVFPSLVPDAEFTRLAERTLALQHSEGWFQEYGGPDLGYLSVTVDCLWDLWDATGDRRFADSLWRALECIRRLTVPLGRRSIGMHNARNTDYLVPYGILRAALEVRSDEHSPATALLPLFEEASAPDHFLGAIDDRYVCHYIGRSLFRALALLEAAPAVTREPAPHPAAPEAVQDRLTAGGHFMQAGPGTGTGLLVTIRKGGILSCRWPQAWFSDFGWIIDLGGREFLTHWWSDQWSARVEESSVVVEGPVFEHRETPSSPLKHIALRILSWIVGRRLIAALKDRLIFSKPAGRVRFCRRIHWRADQLEIWDSFHPWPATARLRPAPRSSKRHVASADSHHIEDFRPARGVEVEREFTTGDGSCQVRTRVCPKPQTR
jgi:hypothetical protein